MGQEETMDAVKRDSTQRVLPQQHLHLIYLHYIIITLEAVAGDRDPCTGHCMNTEEKSAPTQRKMVIKEM